MAMTRQKKENTIAEIKKKLEKATSVAVFDPSNLSVSALNDARIEARKSSVEFKMCRNTIFKLALKDTEFECLENSLFGPSMLVISSDHPAMGARILKNKEYFELVKGASYNGKLIDIEALAKIATKEETIASLLFVLKEISAARLARVLAAVTNKTN